MQNDNRFFTARPYGEPDKNDDRNQPQQPQQGIVLHGQGGVPAPNRPIEEFDFRSRDIELIPGWLGRYLTKRRVQSEIERIELETQRECSLVEFVRTRTSRVQAELDHARLAQQEEIRDRDHIIQCLRRDQQALELKLQMKSRLSPAPVPYGQQELFAKQHERNMAALDAEIQELKIRSVGAIYKQENIDAFVQQPSPAPAPQPPAQQKPSVKDVRRRKVARQKVQRDDQLALSLDELKAQKELKEKLIGMGFDEDEAEHKAAELMEKNKEAGNGRTL